MSDEPRVVQATRKGLAAVVAGDMAAWADLLTDDFRFEDRRMGLQSTLDKKANIEQLSYVVEVGVEETELEVVETRGESVALYRMTLHASGFVIAMLGLNVVTDDGRLRVAVLFDEDELDAARAELDALAANPAG